MTKRADLGLKTLFCTSLCKTPFSAQDQHVLSFSLWVHHLLRAFSKVREFMQSSIFSPRSARFVIFALGAPLFSDFQQSGRVCTKEHFQPEISTFSHFCTGRTNFLQFSAKCTSLCKTAFPARDRHVLSFSHWAHHFLTVFSKVQEFVHNSVFSPTSAGFAIFALGAPLFNGFQNSVLSPRSARFVIFALSAPLFSVFSKVH